MGLGTFLFKNYENNSVILYSGYETNDKLMKAGKTVVIIQHKGKNRAERMIINFKKSHHKMPKRLVNNLNNCSALKDEIATGKYQKSLQDLIELLDFFEEKCITD